MSIAATNKAAMPLDPKPFQQQAACGDDRERGAARYRSRYLRTISSFDGRAFAKRAILLGLHLFALALLQSSLLESTNAATIDLHECGLASVYSSLSEETASGEDTSKKLLTAAHRSLPFGTVVHVDNQENGLSAVVRITDRGPFVGERVIDLSQVAARELGFSDLAKVCIRILWIPDNRPGEEK